MVTLGNIVVTVNKNVSNVNYGSVDSASACTHHNSLTVIHLLVPPQKQHRMPFEMKNAGQPQARTNSEALTRQHDSNFEF